MQLIFTTKEFSTLKDVMDSVQEGSSEEILECMVDSNLIEITVNESIVIISVDTDYTEEFFCTYKKFIPLLIAQTKAIYESFLLFGEDINNVVYKHMLRKTEEKGGEENA